MEGKLAETGAEKRVPDLTSWSLRPDQQTFVPIPLDRDLKPLAAIPDVSADERDKWLLFAPAGSTLTSRLEEIIANFARRRPDVDIIYGDEIVENGDGQVFLKPAMNAALLQACDYIGLPLIVRASAFSLLGGVRAGTGTAAFYDLCLRALQEGFAFERLTEILVRHDGRRPGPSFDDQRAALSTYAAHFAQDYEVLPGRCPSTLRLQRRFRDYPPVTLVVPTRQARRDDANPERARPHILCFLQSLVRSTWPMDKIHVLIGDDVESDAVYRGEWPFALRRVITPPSEKGAFNYAAKMNQLWRMAETDLVVLMNDDTEVRSPDWLEALMTFAQQEDVGGVGARLLFPDDSIQHAGMVCGLFDVCAHPWLGQPSSVPTYQNWAEVHRDWSVVTGAVFATRRAVLEVLNGFDERFRLEFNDVDLCLRMRTLGYRIVYTPFAELTHYEKASRGPRLPPGDEVNLFYKRWRRFLDEDPLFHPGLTRDRFAIEPRRDFVEKCRTWLPAPAGGPGRQSK